MPSAEEAIRGSRAITPAGLMFAGALQVDPLLPDVLDVMNGLGATGVLHSEASEFPVDEPATTGVVDTSEESITGELHVMPPSIVRAA